MKEFRPWMPEEDELIRDAAEKNRLHGRLQRNGYARRMADVACSIDRTLAAVYKRASRLQIRSKAGAGEQSKMDTIDCAICGCDTLASPADAPPGALCQTCEDEHAEYAGGGGCHCTGAGVEVVCGRFRAEVRRRVRGR